MSKLAELVETNRLMKEKIRERFGDKISDMFVDIDTYAIDYIKLIFGRKSMSYEHIAFLLRSAKIHCSEVETTEIALAITPFIEKMKHL